MHHAPRRADARRHVASVTVVQADSRFCQHEDASRMLSTGNPARLHYWWESVRANSLWAARHGYRHRLYCLSEPCEHEVVGRLFTAWCKLQALQHALGSQASGVVDLQSLAVGHGSTENGMLLFLDSDAFWPRAELRFESLLRQYVPAADWVAQGADAVSVFFGCNLPWNGEDRGRRRWNASLVNAERGPPNDGVMLLRNTESARDILRAWWASAAATPQWNRKFAWEQSALWELWKRRPDLARHFRVLHDEERNECMRTMDPDHPSPVVHVAGGMLPPNRREGRLDTLGLRRNESDAWSTCFTRLTSPDGQPRPGCPAQRLEVDVAGQVHLGACEPC